MSNDYQAKLPAVLRIYRDTLTADMKAAIKTAVAELLPVLVARPPESEFGPGERIVDPDGQFTTKLAAYVCVCVCVYIYMSIIYNLLFCQNKCTYVFQTKY